MVVQGWLLWPLGDSWIGDILCATETGDVSNGVQMKRLFYLPSKMSQISAKSGRFAGSLAQQRIIRSRSSAGQLSGISIRSPLITRALA